MWNSLLCIVNGFLEAILQRILVHLLENSHLKEIALKKDQEILRLQADLQRDKDAQASKISDLERDVTTARADIQVKERHLAVLKGQIRDIENRGFTNVKNDKTISLQKEVKDVKDALRAREERIASLMKIIEEERGRVVAKDDGVKLKETGSEMERLMHELDESRRKGEEMAELKQRLETRLEEQDTEMKNKLADWKASYEILLHAKEEQVEAQSALEEQLGNNETELGRLRAALNEREQALSTAIGDSEREDREIDRLRSSFSASHNELDARDGSLATLRQELEASHNQNRSLEEKVKVKTTEAESTYAELLKLTASLATMEKKAADDLKDAQRENKGQTSQVTTLRENLDRSRSEGKARDDAVKELKNQLKEAGDDRRVKENELQASVSRQTELESRLSKQIQDAKALERELADAKGQLIQLTILSEERGLESNGMRNDITKVRNSAQGLITILTSCHFSRYRNTRRN